MTSSHCRRFHEAERKILDGSFETRTTLWISVLGCQEDLRTKDVGTKVMQNNNE